jgi:hypothetical protein
MITDTKKSDYVSRDAILKLLSDDEVARVSTMEAGARLAIGDEYVDLHNPHLGVRCMDGATTMTMGQVLPRSAVHPATWANICSRLLQ